MSWSCSFLEGGHFPGPVQPCCLQRCPPQVGSGCSGRFPILSLTLTDCGLAIPLTWVLLGSHLDAPCAADVGVPTLQSRQVLQQRKAPGFVECVLHF
ncbi:hypothetical protein GW7_07300 [Heterocephalus glaber]|uniref:Uncharacterized protein n=1 Tax=Heterocephalus glaber TaxID=10181 RepID=G5ASK9_HETGA|nr:hypothetical protein GW7_07300 [Heterocephalus glaber]